MNKKKRILPGILALWLLGNISYDHKVENKYEIVMQEEHFANYSNGRVFIGSKEYIDNLTDISANDVLIVDGRNSDDPYMKILSSYKINDSNIRNEILEIINEYEKMHPSSWNRSINSMRVEWFVHNFLYYLNYEKNRTMDVDFNSEQEIYSKKLIKKLIK